ncbi:uncharacterized protein LOC142348755 isoform X2 [Convolutriloba macropyga]|uniref:uncharacterized protein LOC142348755 isoform X2 n=1 Tax=Convolutriloba macropyga TaxID=536237 RepID=UPI003F527F58
MSVNKLLNHFFSHSRLSVLNCVGILMCLFMSAVIDKHALTSTSCGPLTHNVIGTISAANNIYPIGVIWQGINMFTVSIRLMHGFCFYRSIPGDETANQHQDSLASVFALLLFGVCVPINDRSCPLS